MPSWPARAIIAPVKPPQRRPTPPPTRQTRPTSPAHGRPTKPNGPPGTGDLFAWGTAAGVLAPPPPPPSPAAVRALGNGTVRLPDRFSPGWPLVVSYGVGVDSTAVLILLRRSGIRPDAIVFANTGSERPETLAYRAVISEWLARVGFPPLTELQYSSAGVSYTTLYDNCTERVMLPSLAYGGHKHGCSIKFKAEVIDAWVAHTEMARSTFRRGGRVIRVIGYDDSPADNGRRVRFEERGGTGETPRYAYWYPLQDAHWDRERCIAEIQREGLPVPPKSACYFCPSTRPHELIDLVLEHPDLAWKIIEMEQRASPYLTLIDGLWGSGVVGSQGGVPKPGSMSEFILVWMVDGRAYGRLPREGDEGVVMSEVRRTPQLRDVYRLPVLGEPSRDALAALAARGRAAALRIREHFEAVYGPVAAMVEAGRKRAALRAAKAKETGKAKRAALKAGLPWPPPKPKPPPAPKRPKGVPAPPRWVPPPGWKPHVPTHLPKR